MKLLLCVLSIFALALPPPTRAQAGADGACTGENYDHAHESYSSYDACACDGSNCECVNDDSSKDTSGTECGNYWGNSCSGYDDTDFTAATQCCHCDGGGTRAYTVPEFLDHGETNGWCHSTWDECFDISDSVSTSGGAWSFCAQKAHAQGKSLVAVDVTNADFKNVCCQDACECLYDVDGVYEAVITLATITALPDPTATMYSDFASACVASNRICGTNEKVVSNACVACPEGSTNSGGDDHAGPDTECDCGINEKVVSNACVACPEGSTNSAGDDPAGEDTGCHCGINEKVVSNACVACPEGSTNSAGDDSAGADTGCDKIQDCTGEDYEHAGDIYSSYDACACDGSDCVCVNDDTTTDSWGTTCGGYLTSACSGYDDADFTAATQCCHCKDAAPAAADDDAAGKVGMAAIIAGTAILLLMA